MTKVLKTREEWLEHIEKYEPPVNPDFDTLPPAGVFAEPFPMYPAIWYCPVCTLIWAWLLGRKV